MEEKYLIIILQILALVPAVMLHEIAHGAAALFLGDTTARDAGRLSLNPIRHIDPIGTIALPCLLIVLNAGVVFGWAKPVPVNLARVRDPRKGMWVTAIAGPLANLAQIFLAGIAFRAMGAFGLSGGISTGVLSILSTFLYFLALINAVVMVFNLIPIPPLDGSKVVAALLPEPSASAYLRIAPFGFIILIVLLNMGVLDLIITPVFRVVEWWLF